MMLFLACQLLLCILTTNLADINSNIQDYIPEGERHYSELLRKAQSYGDCWKKAVTDLHRDCKHLTEEVQSRLSLSFTNCFLKHSGFDVSPCPHDVSISVCFKNSNDRDRLFSTYTEFFTHTQSICHYLQHKEWQEEAANTILMLTEISQIVSKKLDESSQSQSKILDLAQAALYEQKRLISSGRILNTELQKSRDNARVVYNEFKATTNEQRLLLFEVFDRVKSLQKFVFGEFTGIYTVAYYLIAVLLIYISTSVARTANARIWLILVISLNAALERFLTTYSIEKELSSSNSTLTNEISNWIWLCRKVTCFICLIILIISYYQYKDYNAINNQLLKEIQQQNRELQMFLKGMNLPENMKNNILMYSTKVTPTLCEVTKEKDAAVTRGIYENESLINIPKTSTPEIKARLISLENKENSLLSPISPAVRKKHASKSNKQKVDQKKKSSTGVLNHTFETSQPGEHYSEGNISEVQLTRSIRYSLRSSSRLNSPL